MLARLSQAVEARDPSMRGHSVRVTLLAVAVARMLGWEQERLGRLELGGTLHDVGKLGVSRDILRKPAPLTPDELGEIRLHPEVGVRLLAGLDEAATALACVLFHHERWDGRGYPSGRAGEAIPEEARLLAVADAFDAMTSRRPYRSSVSSDEALRELERCAGTQFDPDMVAAFVDVWGNGTWGKPYGCPHGPPSLAPRPGTGFG
jgi:HD-GYP domain-containing protein (c-di-GMP phosphodiesterase class II)